MQITRRTLLAILAFLTRGKMTLHEVGGRVALEDVASKTRAEHISVDELMIRLLPDAQRYARPPISDFHVGAVALGASGALYFGANLEFGGNALNQSVHGEQSAVSNAYSHQEKGIVAIAVTDAPCGHCRQFLNDITNASRLRIVVKGQPSRTLEQLLPNSFGPKDLGVTAPMFSSAPARLRLEGGDELTRAALQAASRAYAPYSKAPSGCAVATKSGRVFAGSYLENAAFNPSLSPLQAALINCGFAGEDFAAIDRVVLVEMKNASISQSANTKAVLAAVAPQARFDLMPAG